MAELGETADPDALIPGSPSDLYGMVGALTQYADLLQEAGKGLSQISTGSDWSGPAATAFWKAYQPQPSRWLQAGGAFRDAATSLDGYASTLSSAQQQALSAIKLWDSGNHAYQVQAQDLLRTARDEVDSAGDLAARAVSSAASLAPPAPGFFSQVGHLFSDAWDGVFGHGPAPAFQLPDPPDDVTTYPADQAKLLGYGQAIPAQKVPSKIAAALNEVTTEGSYPGAPFGTVYSNGTSYLVGATGGGWVLYDSGGKELGSYNDDLSGPPPPPPPVQDPDFPQI